MMRRMELVLSAVLVVFLSFVTRVHLGLNPENPSRSFNSSFM